MHRLSIVIPCSVVDQRAEDTLVSVLENRPSHCEVIVVTAGRYGDPYDLSGEVKFVEEEEHASTVRLVNSGLEVASADIIHVLEPGTKAVEGWLDRVIERFEDPRVAAVAPALVHSPSDERALCLGVGYRERGARRLVGKRTKLVRVEPPAVLAPSHHAGFYRRDVLVALDGFDDTLSADRADIDFGLAIRQLGFYTAVEMTSHVVVSSAKGPASSPFESGRQLERLYRCYVKPGVWTALGHGLVWSTDLLFNLPRFGAVTRIFGRLAARCESKIQRRHQDRIERAQGYLARLAAEQAANSARQETSRARSGRSVKNIKSLRRAA